MNEMQLSEEWIALVKELKDFFMSKIDANNSKGFILIYKHDRGAPQTEKAMLKFGGPSDEQLADLLHSELDETRKRILKVDTELVKLAGGDAKIMHCLPAHRGFEITDEVAELSNSIMLDQAENRLHFQRALLKKLMS